MGSNKPKLDTAIQAAMIGCAGTIIAAIIGGCVYAAVTLMGQQRDKTQTPTPATPISVTVDTTPSTSETQLFFEDFEGEVSKDLEITKERDQKGTFGVVDDGTGGGNDVLQLSNLGEDSWEHIRIGSESWDFENGFIEFQFNFIDYSSQASEGEANIDFYFRKDPAGGQSYVLIINPVLAIAQLYAVEKTDKSWTLLDTSTLNNPAKNKWHLVRVHAQGNQIRIYLDDLNSPILESSEDYELSKGKISFDIREKIIVQLDNIKVVSQP